MRRSQRRTSSPKASASPVRARSTMISSVAKVSMHGSNQRLLNGLDAKRVAVAEKIVAPWRRRVRNPNSISHAAAQRRNEVLKLVDTAAALDNNTQTPN